MPSYNFKMTLFSTYNIIYFYQFSSVLSFHSHMHSHNQDSEIVQNTSIALELPLIHFSNSDATHYIRISTNIVLQIEPQQWTFSKIAPQGYNNRTYILEVTNSLLVGHKTQYIEEKSCKVLYN